MLSSNNTIDLSCTVFSLWIAFQTLLKSVTTVTKRSGLPYGNLLRKHIHNVYILSRSRTNKLEQDSIPVGFVPTTLVTTTRCQYWLGRVRALSEQVIIGLQR